MTMLEFFSPGSVEDAVRILAQWSETAAPVAGATDLWANIRSGKAQPQALVSLRGISALRGLAYEGGNSGGNSGGKGGGAGGDGGAVAARGALTIGAATPHADIEDSVWVAEHFTGLQQACAGLGSRQVRNVGTLGGNICNAAPCADSATGLMLFDAAVVLVGPDGVREMPLADFFIGPGQTRRGPAEILTQIRVADPGPHTYSGYQKHTRRKGVELAMMSVGVRITLADDGVTVAKARISLGVCAPTPTCSAGGEAYLEGKPLTRENAAQAAELAAAESRVRDSWRGKAWYRREMIRVLVPRVIEQSGAFAAVEAR
jgi:CO/xanthine dehydrogenase FAD-binding subunit